MAKYPGYIMLRQGWFAPLRNDNTMPVWARALFYILQNADYKSGIAYVTASDMVKKLGASRNAVDAAVAFLISKGFISHKNGKGRTKHFVLSPALHMKPKENYAK